MCWSLGVLSHAYHHTLISQSVTSRYNITSVCKYYLVVDRISFDIVMHHGETKLTLELFCII